MTIITKNGQIHRVPTGSVVMLGYFDGFHKGHMALSDAACQIKKRKNASSVVLWTFDRLSKGKTITNNEEKAEAFFSYIPKELLPESAAVIFEEFSSLSHLSGEEFVKTVLKDQLGAVAVVCGFNFRFGKGGACGSTELSRYCGDCGIECCVVSPVTVEGDVISSTGIRRLLEEGKAETAAERMGRPYSVTSPVLHGKRIGHSLGFPTVNQRIPEDKVIPAFGVYACRVRFPDGADGFTEKDGVCNIGFRPTVNGDPADVTLETYIFDYNGDLYGKEITVSLCTRIRGEMRFSSREALSCQIEKDKEAAIDLLKAERRTME